MRTPSPPDFGYAELVAAMQVYFDGLYHSDTERLNSVFHPEAIYTCATTGDLTRMTMPDYFAMVARREAPAVRRETRTDRVVSIAFAGPVTAHVTATCSIGPKHFTDLLSFVKLNGRWQIIAKVFHYDLATP
ncbi:MAG TPA: nuclear transport factor 2 family protein [Rhabdaerophilum sp.]|nr:nuclear transport factor 2 family protein [Rhabdaerophilum sp.]